MKAETIDSFAKACLVPLALGAVIASVPFDADARPKADPSYSRTTIIPVDRYHHESRIVRERSVGKEHVRFSAQAQAVGDGAMLVFEIRSESDDRKVVRWQCTAIANVDECFKKPVKVRYLPQDERVVLSVVVVPVPEPFVGHYAEK